MSNDTIPRRGFLVGAGAAGAGARMYRAGPFHQGAPEQGYQLSLTPRDFFAAGVQATNAWSRKTYGKAFALEDFRCSNAMKRADFNWDAANLRDYLHDPQAKVKGNHMPFSGYANLADADDVVAYLQTCK